MLDCHATAAEPARGPVAVNPAAPRTGTAIAPAITEMPSNAWGPNKAGCFLLWLVASLRRGSKEGYIGQKPIFQR